MANTRPIDALRQNRLLKTQSQVSGFDIALADLAKTLDPAQLPELFLVFTDACEQHEVMWGLIHLIESFDLSAYLDAMADSIPAMLQEASDWVEILQCRVLNDEVCRDLYAKSIARLPDVKRVIVQASLRKIAEKDGDLRRTIDIVLSPNTSRP